MKSENVVPLRKSATHQLETAVVISESLPFYDVETADAQLKASKAFSCLVTPSVGDKVLLSASLSEAYIIAVLERTHQKMVMDFPGDTTLRTKKGNLTIHSQNEVLISSAKETQIVSPSVVQTSQESSIASKQLNIEVDRINSLAKQVSFISKSLVSVTDTVTHRAKNVMRFVEGVENAHFGHLIQKVKHLLTLRTYQGSISAKKDLKIDGERIHMG